MTASAAFRIASSITGFSEVELAAILADGTVGGTAADHWQGMPAYTNENKRAFRQVLVSFATPADVDAFALALGLELTDKTKAIWYPPVEPNKVAGQDYALAAS